MTNYFLSDTSSLVYAYRAGGSQLLDTYMDVAKAEGYELAISNTVRLEIRNGPLNRELLAYIADRQIPVLEAPDTERELRAATDPDERSRLAKNAGERSLIEIAAREHTQGRDTVVWSDDKHFVSPQIQRQLQRELPGLQTTTTAELLDRSYRDGFIAEAEYKQHLAGYQNQPVFKDSPRLNSFDTALSGAVADLAEGDASVRAPGGQRGYASAQLLIGEVPRNTLIRSGGLLATGADLTASATRVAELLEQDNPAAAQSEASHAVARNVGGWLGGSAAAATVGTSGYLPAAIVVADAMLMSKAFDKAVDLKENRDITRQTDRQGVVWTFDGRNWVREERIDKTADGRDDPVEGRLGAGYEKARELGAYASARAVELALAKTPRPQDPFDVPAGPGDRRGLDNQNWRRDPETEQWQRLVKTAVTGAGERGVYQQQIATPERAAELNREAVVRIQHNIANGRESVAAAYLESHAAQRSRDFVEVPSAVQWARPRPDEAQGSDGQRYRRGADGEWSGGGRVAQGNLALELDLTQAAREPSLQRFDARIAALEARPAPTEQQRQQNQLLHQYRVTGERTELTPQWQRAIELAVQRTREQHGIAGPGALQLQPRDGAYGADSAVAHYRRGVDGVNRLVAVTSTEEILQARQQVLAQDAQRAPPSKPDAAQTPQHVRPDARHEPEPPVDLSRFPREDRAMIAKIRASVPDGVTDEQLAAGVLAAKRNGIRDADNLGPVGVVGATLWMDRTVPGFHTGVNLAQPAPPLQDTLRDTLRFDQEQAQLRTQEREREQHHERQAGATRAQP
ncbi:hypothetical protein RDV84_10290 [Lysobacter yananisis]|uniref:Large Ala/Gln-rich protein n=2 Tax=Lysobacter TaxID=68 RepID=A0A0S2DNN0_LYSEN|nr:MULTISPECIES: hypothetical protein [Lysobacter]ALN59919.1 large Ala/Gln-rich protein [Lysobacter enzymogenes]QCW27978.1 hypothetical protein FE772_22345 [Lysobacter enzymogenes]WMT05207.1 hypothetical protein RDV84_10290 [Lysobacter yananisis]